MRYLRGDETFSIRSHNLFTRAFMLQSEQENYVAKLCALQWQHTAQHRSDGEGRGAAVGSLPIMEGGMPPVRREETLHTLSLLQG